MKLDATQVKNFTEALSVTDNYEQKVRLAFAIWSESRGYIYANDGTNQSDSPGFDKNPQWPAILRRSLSIPHDRVGNNGRSTGMLQQISTNVGGGWGDMVGTMTPTVSAVRFLNELRVTSNPVYEGILQTPTGTEKVKVNLTAIAADVLRVQRPLADEAKSSNYDATQVAIAIEIVAQLSKAAQPVPKPNPAPPVESDLLEALMADRSVVIHFTDGVDTHYAAYLLDGTWVKIPRDAVDTYFWILGLAGVPVKSWAEVQGKPGGSSAADPRMFGREVSWDKV
jgi:hypothetical protein